MGVKRDLHEQGVSASLLLGGKWPVSLEDRDTVLVMFLHTNFFGGGGGVRKLSRLGTLSQVRIFFGDRIKRDF